MALIVNLDPVGLRAAVAQNVGGFATGQASQQMAIRQQQADDNSLQVANNADAQNRRLYLEERRIGQAGDLGYAKLDQNLLLADQKSRDAESLQNLKNLAATGKITVQGMQEMQRLEKKQTFDAEQNKLKQQGRVDLQNDQQAFTGEQNQLKAQNQQGLQQQMLEFKANQDKARAGNAAMKYAAERADKASDQDFADLSKAANDNINLNKAEYDRIGRAYANVTGIINHSAAKGEVPAQDLIGQQQYLKALLVEAEKSWHDAMDARPKRGARAVPPGAPQQGPAVPPYGGQPQPQGQAQPLTPDIAAQILNFAGGDKELARQIARENGYAF